MYSGFLYGENASIATAIIVIIATGTSGCCEFARYPPIQFDIAKQKNQLNIPFEHMEPVRHAVPTAAALSLKT
jgi:hypothetical protein